MRVHLTLATLFCVATICAPAEQSGNDAWISRFHITAAELGPTGRNAFFILEPGQRAVYASGTERLVITVLDETKVVDGVTTRIVEERETKAGQLVEVSRNYFAISTRTHDVFYFGEAGDSYKDGRAVAHEGAWQAGEQGARFGLMMPAEPRVSQKYYQEVAPKIAMDRAEIVGLHVVVKTPAGEFKDCLKVEETTPLEPGAREYKYYAPNVGLVQDGSLKLIPDRD
jgi:hypothetical protein